MALTLALITFVVIFGIAFIGLSVVVVNRYPTPKPYVQDVMEKYPSVLTPEEIEYYRVSAWN